MTTDTAMTTDVTMTHTLPGPRLKRVTEFIALHLDQDLTLAQLGAVACMSPFHFARLFKRSTGLPPHRFVVRARIDQARALLAGQRRLPIRRIAEVVGFRTVSHFTAVFHRVTGTTPRAYRAAYRPVSTGGHDDVL
jgi:AraC family transcriptional regulator